MEELVLLREFADLARTCNFQDTADNMNISSSALSKHIRKLEEEIGFSLFDRSTRTVTLSKYGVVFQEYVDQILELENQCMDKLEILKSEDDRRVRIGFLPMLGRYGILEIIAIFSKSHPEIRLQIVESYRLAESLADGAYDFIFVDAHSPAVAGSDRVLLMQDYQVAAFPPDHPLADQDYVTLEDLYREPNIILHTTPENKLSMGAQTFLDAYYKAGGIPKNVLTSRYLNTMLKMVSNGQGVCLINSMEALELDHINCKFVKVSPEVNFQIYVYYMKNRIRTEGIATFLEYLNHISEKI